MSPTRRMPPSPLSWIVAALVMVLLLSCGCATKPQGATLQEKQSFVLGTSSEILAMVYDQQPKVEENIKVAPGYAVFTYRLSKLPIVIGGLGGGGGYGFAVNNETGEQTFMKVTMGEWGLGLGTRVFGSVFVFDDAETMDRFIKRGWEFGGGADAALKNEEAGLATNVGMSVAPGMKIYSVSMSGVAYAATLRGTKYSVDQQMND